MDLLLGEIVFGRDPEIRHMVAQPYDAREAHAFLVVERGQGGLVPIHDAFELVFGRGDAQMVELACRAGAGHTVLNVDWYSTCFGGGNGSQVVSVAGEVQPSTPSCPVGLIYSLCNSVVAHYNRQTRSIVGSSARMTQNETEYEIVETPNGNV